MENRYSKRVPVVMDVLLFHNNIPVVHCKTHNIGTDGMFVVSGSLSYPTDTIVKVEFCADSQQGPEYYSLPAMVIHQSNSGLGLMLPGGESLPMQEWRKVVKQAITKNMSTDAAGASGTSAYRLSEKHSGANTNEFDQVTFMVR